MRRRYAVEWMMIKSKALSIGVWAKALIHNWYPYVLFGDTIYENSLRVLINI
jgi:hypothetical protein